MRTLCLILAAVLLSAPAGLAQSEKKKKGNQTRTVQGTVTGPDDQMVNGAVVQLKNLKTLQIRSFITQKDGAYHFNELSSDVDYELRADYSGESSSPKELSSFDNRKEAILNLKLNPKKEAKK
jgi:carboxypeptidase family protein